MTSLTLSLPLPPTANGLFATDFKTKRRFVSKDYAAWRKVAADRIIADWESGGRPAFAQHIGVTIHLGTDYRSDISGRVKAIEDAIVTNVPGFPDDRYIDFLEVRRVPEVDGALVLIRQLERPIYGEARPIGDILKPIVARILEGKAE